MKGTPRRPVQYFSDEYLARCRTMRPDEIAGFVEGFRVIHGGGRTASRLISLKVPEALLEAFRQKCRLEGIRYQTQIKRLMKDWLMQSRSGQSHRSHR